MPEYEGTGYLTDDSGTSRRFATYAELSAVEVGGVGGIEDVPGLEEALDAKAETPIAISDVTDLQDALDDKLESPIAVSDVTGLQAAIDGKQPLDSDLTSIAALTTTSFGRGLLALADAAALRTSAGIAPADNIAVIASTPAATAEAVADKLNALLAALIAAGLMDAS